MFTDVISRRTAYGLIWLGFYRKHPSVTKMIMLTSGIHYDRTAGEYRTPQEQRLSNVDAEKHFVNNERKPFLHQDFMHRRSMTPNAFFAEIDELQTLSKLGLAPKVYGYGVNQEHDVHYGFVVMEKVDCSLKDIYLKRELNHDENKLVHDLIDSLHNEHGIIHGDLKPSNIGVYLNRKGHIVDACFFDCQKIRHREQCTPEEFRKLADREATNYHKHIVKNKKEGSYGFVGGIL